MKPPRNGRSQRQKGDRYERELVNEFKDRGLSAQRVPLSGATAYAKGDIEIIAGFDGKTKFVGECKRRKNLPEWIESAIGENDFMAMREDNGDTLIVLRLGTFAELLQ